MKKLYLFDFDGTLTYKDTMFLYLHFYNPKKFRQEFFKHLFLFVLVKLKLTDAESVKKSFISSILKGQTRTKIIEKSEAFFEAFYPKIIREHALDFIKNIDTLHTESYIVTASLDIWVKPFADKFKINLISTEAEFKNDIFTGNFSTPNCNGLEKLNRIKLQIGQQKFDKKIAYGDTEGDKPMLNFADESYYRFFH